MSTQSANLNPYVGPHPFETDQSHLFFGREREASELLALVIADRVVLFFAQSGAGKTSLLKARLIPELLGKKFEVLPVGRVSGERPAGLDVDNIFVFNLMAYLNQVDFEDAALAQLRLCDFLVQLTQIDGKWVFEKAAPPMESAASPGGPDQVSDQVEPIEDDLEIRPRILIIDQFEEILTAHPEAWEQRTEFFMQIRQSLEEDPYLWVLFAMREDFVGALSPYAHLMPDGLRMRYHMLPMEEESALAAVKGPAALYGHPFSPGVAELLIKNLRQIEDQPPQVGSVEASNGVGNGVSNGVDTAKLGQFVEPVQLQVVCRQLWDSLETPPGTPITSADLEKLAGGAGPGEFVNDALRVYYEQSLDYALSRAPEEISERTLRNWFDQVVITREGKRNLIHQSDTESDGMPNPVVTALVDRFILRRETRGDRRWVELAHDRFVEPIRRSNRQWFAREPSPTRAWAELWLNAGKDPSLLISGDKLAQTLERLKAHPKEFQPLEQEFIQTSEAMAQKTAEKRRRAILIVLIGSVAALLLLLAVLAYLLRSESESRRRSVAAEVLAVSAKATAESALDMEAVARATTEAALSESQMRERVALADGLAIKSVSMLDRPQLALLLAAQSSAIQRAKDEQVAPSVEQALHRVLGATGGTVIPLEHVNADPSAAALSGDDQLAIAGEPGVVHVWNLADTNTAPLLLSGHTGIVTSLRFALDGKTLVSLDEMGVIRLWNLSGPTPVPTVVNAGGEEVWAVALLTNTLASADSTGRVRIVPLTQPRQPLREWDDYGGLATFAVFSRDGNYLVTAGNDYDQGSVRVWDLTAALPFSATISSPGAQVGSLAASPTTDQIAVNWDDGTIKLYDLPSLEATVELRGPSPKATAIAFWSDASGLQLAGSYADGRILVWDVENPEGEPMVLRGHEGEIRQLAVGPRNTMASVGAGGEVRVWDKHNLTYEPQLLIEGQNPVVQMALSPGGDSLATAYVGDPQAHLLDLDDVQTTRRVGNETGLDVTAVAFGPSDNMLLIGTLEGALSAWDTDTGAQLWIGSGHDARINDIAVERERGWVATASDDGTVRTWDMREGNELSALALLTPSPLLDVAFSPDGGILAAAGLDGLVHLWDTASGEEMPPLGVDTGEFGFISLAFHADEGLVELAAAKEDGSIWRWDLGSRIALPSPPPGEPVHAIAYDHRHLITAHDNGAISLWYLDAMDALPTRLAGHMAGINDLIVDPQNEAYLLSAGNDGFVRRWDLAVESLVEKACRGAGHTISADELKLYLPSQASGPEADDICGKTLTP